MFGKPPCRAGSVGTDEEDPIETSFAYFNAINAKPPRWTLKGKPQTA